jgi:hypothetical protein
MKMWENEGIASLFLTSSLDECEWKLHASAVLPSEKELPVPIG